MGGGQGWRRLPPFASESRPTARPRRRQPVRARRIVLAVQRDGTSSSAFASGLRGRRRAVDERAGSFPPPDSLINGVDKTMLRPVLRPTAGIRLVVTYELGTPAWLPRREWWFDRQARARQTQRAPVSAAGRVWKCGCDRRARRDPPLGPRRALARPRECMSSTPVECDLRSFRV